jgi:hypothetical protein
MKIYAWETPNMLFSLLAQIQDLVTPEGWVVQGYCFMVLDTPQINFKV